MHSAPVLEKKPKAQKGLDVGKIRKDFPILSRRVRGKPLVYLDNAATSQKPQGVLNAVDEYYREENSNVHRGVHFLSELATQKYEESREKVRRFINAQHAHEIVFVRGTTEAINLVAQSYGGAVLGPGDEVLISAMEHHSGIVPWQIVCERTGARLRVIPMNDRGELLLDDYEKFLTPRTRIVGLVHISNALGTVNPVKKMIAKAHTLDVPVLVDGAQAIPHRPVDVQDLDCDFYAFSGHKMFGPTGIGVLYGKTALFESMPPFQGGGDMIKSVTFEKTIYNDLPYKFEAGTPNIGGAIGLGAAVDYLGGLDRAAVQEHEDELLSAATAALEEFDGLRIVGTAAEKSGVLSFVLEGVHPHDAGTVLDSEGIAVRTGHHCAQPVMDRFGVPATVRASFAFYNTREEVDTLVRGLHKVKEVFG